MYGSLSSAVQVTGPGAGAGAGSGDELPLQALTISGGKRAPRPSVSTGQPRTSGVCPEGDIQRQVHEAPLMREVEVPSAAPGAYATFEVPVEFQDGKIVIDVRAAEQQANAVPGQVN